jgi:hypothetical protein
MPHPKRQGPPSGGRCFGERRRGARHGLPPAAMAANPDAASCSAADPALPLTTPPPPLLRKLRPGLRSASAMLGTPVEREAPTHGHPELTKVVQQGIGQGQAATGVHRNHRRAIGGHRSNPLQRPHITTALCTGVPPRCARTLGARAQALPLLLAQHAQQRLRHADVVCLEEVGRLRRQQQGQCRIRSTHLKRSSALRLLKGKHVVHALELMRGPDLRCWRHAHSMTLWCLTHPCSRPSSPDTHCCSINTWQAVATAPPPCAWPQQGCGGTAPRLRCKQRAQPRASVGPRKRLASRQYARDPLCHLPVSLIML